MVCQSTTIAYPEVTRKRRLLKVQFCDLFREKDGSVRAFVVCLFAGCTRILTVTFRLAESMIESTPNRALFLSAPDGDHVQIGVE